MRTLEEMELHRQRVRDILILSYTQKFKYLPERPEFTRAIERTLREVPDYLIFRVDSEEVIHGPISEAFEQNIRAEFGVDILGV